MSRLALGLMSGTSCDGVSVALAQYANGGGSPGVRVLAHRTVPYSATLLSELRRAEALNARQLSRLNMVLGEWFARAALGLLRRARVAPSRVTVVGSHGHPVYHGPRDRVPSTLQIGEPAVIAERTGIPVVAQFRMRDVAAGGEGAPLVPAFDEACFGGGPVRALQNIGGIANVTVVGRGIRTIAFDTGPGNGLMDLVVQRASRGRLAYDAGGRLAAGGRVNEPALKMLLRHPYFRRPPPKSTGRETFNEALLERVFGSHVRRAPHDVLATLNALTALSIVEGIRRFVPQRPTELIVSGGGARNQTLIRHLARLFAPIPVRRIERYGIPAQAKEPVAFAWLALRAVQGRPNHLPHTTGARHACLLGSMTPGHHPLPHSLTPSRSH
jgi:anhydro-N-acetylmuramic acid kinase